LDVAMEEPDKTRKMPSFDVVDRDELAERSKRAEAALANVRPPPNVKPGAMIGDKYRVEREIGRGGFGVVVRAVHLTLDQRVAIKVLTEGEGSTDADFEEDAARFRREAKATAALKSEHVVRVLDVDVLECGYPYIVMEYLEGRTLHELVYTQGPLLVEDAVDYVLQVLAALAEAHSVGIVHRDLKPANVFLSKGIGGVMHAKVLDFGVSKMIGGASRRLTRTGAVVGTVAYMAPEQMIDAKRVDGRADLWSAGLVLYEALAKTHPFGSASAGAKVVTAILHDPVPPLSTVRPDIPPALEQVVMRMLEKSPDRRFATALEVANALAPFAPLRSRPVLEEIRRSPPPSGAAAPGATTVREPARPSAAPAPSKAPRTALGLLLATTTATVIVGAIAAYALYAPRSRAKTPSVEVVAEPSAAASVTLPPVAVPTVMETPPVIASAAPSLSTKPEPKPAHPKTPAPSKSCDPPYVWDPVANVKRHKTECL
jgi:serine/threonine-protein kinase